MLICIYDVLNQKELKLINDFFDLAKFEDGDNTAGWNAKGVKNNLQIIRNNDPNIENIDSLLIQALYKKKEFVSATLAKSIHPFLYSKSLKGQGYGVHIDNAFMGSEYLIRSDISCTIFLNDDYEGGDLIIDNFNTKYKLKKGCAILYPSNSLHKVENVLSGERRVAVTWVQSIVKDIEKRQVLFDLDKLRTSIFEKLGKNEDFDNINKSYINLFRMWGEV